ncbi:hypothetical protein M8J77_020080 [Diaphorina citri]|nr:hypothetical protein M8J77_020080 [Diaphorina citri]
MMNNVYYGGMVGHAMPESSVHEDEIEKIINEVKSQGVFDEFRRDCISDVDTKPAYQNLKSRVETSVQKFLEKLKFDSNLNKNVVRENLRKHVIESGYYNPGLDRITDQIVNPKMMPVLYPKVEKIVCEHLNIPYIPTANPAANQTLPQSLSYANTNGSLTNHIPSLISGIPGTESLQMSNSNENNDIKSEVKEETQEEEADVKPKPEPNTVTENGDSKVQNDNKDQIGDKELCGDEGGVEDMDTVISPPFEPLDAASAVSSLSGMSDLDSHGETSQSTGSSPGQNSPLQNGTSDSNQPTSDSHQPTSDSHQPTNDSHQPTSSPAPNIRPRGPSTPPSNEDSFGGVQNDCTLSSSTPDLLNIGGENSRRAAKHDATREDSQDETKPGKSSQDEARRDEGGPEGDEEKWDEEEKSGKSFRDEESKSRQRDLTDKSRNRDENSKRREEKGWRSEDEDERNEKDTKSSVEPMEIDEEKEEGEVDSDEDEEKEPQNVKRDAKNEEQKTDQEKQENKIKENVKIDQEKMAKQKETASKSDRTSRRRDSPFIEEDSKICNRERNDSSSNSRDNWTSRSNAETRTSHDKDDKSRRNDHSNKHGNRNDDSSSDFEGKSRRNDRSKRHRDRNDDDSSSDYKKDNRDSLKHKDRADSDSGDDSRSSFGSSRLRSGPSDSRQSEERSQDSHAMEIDDRESNPESQASSSAEDSNNSKESTKFPESRSQDSSEFPESQAQDSSEFRESRSGKSRSRLQESSSRSQESSEEFRESRSQSQESEGEESGHDLDKDDGGDLESAEESRDKSERRDKQSSERDKSQSRDRRDQKSSSRNSSTHYKSSSKHGSSSSRDRNSSTRERNSSTRETHSSSRDKESSRDRKDSKSRDKDSSSRDKYSSSKSREKEPSKSRDSGSSSRDKESSSKSSDKESSSKSRDSNSKSRDSKSSRSEDKAAGSKDSKSRDKESSSSREKHSSSRDSHGRYKHSSSKSSYRDKESSSRDKESSSRDKESSSRDKESSSRDKESSSRAKDSRSRDSSSRDKSSRRDKTSTSREKSSRDKSSRSGQNRSSADSDSQADTEHDPRPESSCREFEEIVGEQPPPSPDGGEGQRSDRAGKSSSSAGERRKEKSRSGGGGGSSSSGRKRRGDAPVEETEMDMEDQEVAGFTTVGTSEYRVGPRTPPTKYSDGPRTPPIEYRGGPRTPPTRVGSRTPPTEYRGGSRTPPTRDGPRTPPTKYSVRSRTPPTRIGARTPPTKYSVGPRTPPSPPMGHERDQVTPSPPMRQDRSQVTPTVSPNRVQETPSRSTTPTGSPSSGEKQFTPSKEGQKQINRLKTLLNICNKRQETLLVQKQNEKHRKDEGPKRRLKNEEDKSPIGKETDENDEKGAPKSPRENVVKEKLKEEESVEETVEKNAEEKVKEEEGMRKEMDEKLEEENSVQESLIDTSAENMEEEDPGIENMEVELNEEETVQKTAVEETTEEQIEEQFEHQDNVNEENPDEKVLSERTDDKKMEVEPEIETIPVDFKIEKLVEKEPVPKMENQEVQKEGTNTKKEPPIQKTPLEMKVAKDPRVPSADPCVRVKTNTKPCATVKPNANTTALPTSGNKLSATNLGSANKGVPVVAKKPHSKHPCVKKLIEINMWDKEKTDKKFNRDGKQLKSGTDTSPNNGTPNGPNDKENAAKNSRENRDSKESNKPDPSKHCSKDAKKEVIGQTEAIKSSKDVKENEIGKTAGKSCNAKNDLSKSAVNELDKHDKVSKTTSLSPNKPINLLKNKQSPEKGFSPNKAKEDTTVISLDPEQLGIKEDELIRALQVTVTVNDCRLERTNRNRNSTETAHGKASTENRMKPPEKESTDVRKSLEKAEKSDTLPLKKTATSMKEMLKISKERHLRKQKSQEEMEIGQEKENKVVQDRKDPGNEKKYLSQGQTETPNSKVARFQTIKLSLEKKLLKTPNNNIIQSHLERVNKLLAKLERRKANPSASIESNKLDDNNKLVHKNKLHDNKLVDRLETGKGMARESGEALKNKPSEILRNITPLHGKRNEEENREKEGGDVKRIESVDAQTRLGKATNTKQESSPELSESSHRKPSTDARDKHEKSPKLERSPKGVGKDTDGKKAKENKRLAVIKKQLQELKSKKQQMEQSMAGTSNQGGNKQSSPSKVGEKSHPTKETKDGKFCVELSPNSKIIVPAHMLPKVLLEPCDELANEYRAKLLNIKRELTEKGSTTHVSQDKTENDFIAALKKQIAEEIKNKVKASSPPHNDSSSMSPKQITSTAIVDLKELRQTQNDIITVYNKNQSKELFSSNTNQSPTQTMEHTASETRKDETTDGQDSSTNINIQISTSVSNSININITNQTTPSCLDEEDEFIKRYVKPLTQNQNVSIDIRENDKEDMTKTDKSNEIKVDTQETPQMSCKRQLRTEESTNSVNDEHESSNVQEKDGIVVSTNQAITDTKDAFDTVADKTIDGASNETINDVNNETLDNSVIDEPTTSKDMKTNLFEQLQQDFYNNQDKYLIPNRVENKVDNSDENKEDDSLDENKEDKEETKDTKCRIFEELEKEFYNNPGKFKKLGPKRKTKPGKQEPAKKTENKVNLFEKLEQDFYNNQKKYGTNEKPLENDEDIIEIESDASNPLESKHQGTTPDANVKDIANNDESLEESSRNSADLDDKAVLEDANEQTNTETQDSIYQTTDTFDTDTVDSAISQDSQDANSHANSQSLSEDEKDTPNDNKTLDSQNAFHGFKLPEKIESIKRLHSLTDLIIAIEQHLSHIEKRPSNERKTVKKATKRRKSDARDVAQDGNNTNSVPTDVKRPRIQESNDELVGKVNDANATGVRKAKAQRNSVEGENTIDTNQIDKSRIQRSRIEPDTSVTNRIGKSIQRSVEQPQNTNTNTTGIRKAVQGSSFEAEASENPIERIDFKRPRLQRSSEESGYGSVDLNEDTEEEPPIPRLVIKRRIGSNATNQDRHKTGVKANQDGHLVSKVEKSKIATSTSWEEDKSTRIATNRRERTTDKIDRETKEFDRVASNKEVEISSRIGNKKGIDGKSDRLVKGGIEFSRIATHRDEGSSGNNKEGQQYSQETLQMALDAVNNDINDHVRADIKILPRPASSKPKRPPPAQQKRYDASDLYKPRLSFTSKRRKLPPPT